MSGAREALKKALDKPLPRTMADVGNLEFFNPWGDIIHGIYGDYSSECDDLMIAALKAVQDSKTFELINEQGLAAEFALYILAGHWLTEYGTSPRGGWPDPTIADLWPELIEKWESYAKVRRHDG